MRLNRKLDLSTRVISLGAVLLIASPFLVTEVHAKEKGKLPSWKVSFDAGEAALTRGSLREAEKKFRESLAAVKKEARGSEKEQLCMKRLAATLALEDKTREARSIYRKLLGRTEKKFGRRSSEVEPFLMALGSIEESAGNHPLAMSYYNRALKINESNYGVYSPAYANTLSRLGRVNHRLGNTNAAQLQYKQAISILSKQPNLAAARQLKSIMHEYGDLIKGDDQSNSELIDDFDKDIGGTGAKSGELPEGESLEGKQLRQHLKKDVVVEPERVGLRPPIVSGRTASGVSASGGSRYEKLSRERSIEFDDSQTDANEAIALRGISRPESAASLEPAYETVKKSVFKQQRYSLNEKQYKRKIAIDLDSLGPNHPSVANDLSGLAQLYMEQEKYEKAKPLLEKAVRIYDAVYGADNSLSVNVRILLAQVEFQLGSYDAAASHYQAALSQGQKTPGTLETARVLNGLAYLYYHQGQLHKSSALYQWALSSTESAAGKDDPLVAACLKDYAKVLRDMGQIDKAEKLELRAGAILANTN